jgi:predicted TIM-barrel fold metal-dependent hydrolase
LKNIFPCLSDFFTQPPLKLVLETFGVDNIMFSVDCPFSTNQMEVDFLNTIELTDEQIEKIAHGNADKPLNLTNYNYFVR